MNRDDQKEPLTERTEPTSSGAVAAQPSLTGPVAAPSSLISPANESPHFSTQPSAGSQSSVELHIDELVLHGFAPGDRYLIGDAVERELTRLFTEQGAPTAIMRDVDIANLDGGTIETTPGSTSEMTGIQLARKIYGGLGQ